MTPHDYMSRARDAAEQIEPLTRELAALKDQLEAAQVWRTRKDSIGHGKGLVSDPTEREAEALIEYLPGKIADIHTELSECKRIVGNCLATLNDIRLSLGRDVALTLEIYWIDGAETWAEVAEEMQTSRLLVVRMRDQAYSWMEHHRLH